MIGRYHDGERWVAALIREGHKLLHVTCVDDTGVRHFTDAREYVGRTGVKRVTLRDCVAPLLYKGKPYPLTRLVRQFREIGAVRGITESAKDELDRAVAEIGGTP